MKYNKYYFLIIVCIILTYISLVFHVNHNGNIAEFDNLYAGLKKIEQKEDNFFKFISLGGKACDYLLKKLMIEKDDLIKSDILQIISFIKCSNCEDKLISFLNDPNWRVRFFTIDVLDKLEYEKLSARLPGIILNDTNQKVKIGAIMAIGKSGNAKDIRFLENLATLKKYQNKHLSKAINIALVSLRSNSNNK